MHKALIVAIREYHAMVRTKAFIISILLMPILMGGAVLLQKMLEGRTDLETKTIAVLDPTGVLGERLVQTVWDRNESEIYDRQTNRQISPRIRVELGPPGAATDELRLELSERVRKNELLGFAELLPEILDLGPEAPYFTGVFHADNLSAAMLRRRFERSLEEVVQTERLQRLGLDPVLVKRGVAPVRLEGLGLYVRTAAGEIRKADKTGSEIARFVPLGMLMLMFMSVLMVTQPMLQSVLEEKQQRIAEVLLGSARPFDLMLGKLLGNVGVALTILAVYFAGIYATARSYGYVELLPTHLLGWFVLYEVLAVLLFGSVMLAIGAACNELKEAQSYLVPVTLVMVLPVMVWFEVMRAPLSTFATALSLFPPATPMLMLLRMSATEAVPLWQPILGVALVVAATALCVFAAGRIFRIGLLSMGKAPNVAELMRWIVRG
jgi:ABC-2 type transport system permease protein